jgi:hypothetical protein|tara:strand:+ start:200 stop:436 length:237 start_codon:yes stop_codon:yes gene_type:complete
MVARYANGNRKAQQKAYNKTPHGKKLRVNANRADRRSKRAGLGVKGDGKDNAHYPGTNRTRLTSARYNRGNERRKARR